MHLIIASTKLYRISITCYFDLIVSADNIFTKILNILKLFVV